MAFHSKCLKVYSHFYDLKFMPLTCLRARERLADDKLCEISVCVSPTQAKKYAIKPVIPKTYHQPDAL